MSTTHVFAASGHRPNKLGGHGVKAEARRFALAVRYLSTYPPASAITGMAQGWDTAFAEAAISLSIPLIAAVPFRGQEDKWCATGRDRYRSILRKAEKVIVVSSGGYSARAMNDRNKWMVDHCTCVIALWDGSESGTANCLRYAETKGRPVVNLWPWWEA